MRRVRRNARRRRAVVRDVVTWQRAAAKGVEQRNRALSAKAIDAQVELLDGLLDEPAPAQKAPEIDTSFLDDLL